MMSARLVVQAKGKRVHLFGKPSGIDLSPVRNTGGHIIEVPIDGRHHIIPPTPVFKPVVDCIIISIRLIADPFNTADQPALANATFKDHTGIMSVHSGDEHIVWAGNRELLILDPRPHRRPCQARIGEAQPRKYEADQMI